MRSLLAAASSFLLVACGSAPSPAPAPVEAPSSANQSSEKPGDVKKDDKAKEEQKAKDDARRQKAKDLRNKRRELDYAKVEAQTTEIDRRVRAMGVEATLARTAAELEKARAELEVFLKDLKPREIEEKKISLDQSTYRTEHSKDELGELVAMYEADEFARTTKELVLKRGRRDLEMAERYLAVAKKESAHLETYALPWRERELRQKVADAEVERKKAELEADKARIEMDLSTRKATERIKDLEDDVKELEEAIAKEEP
ncbi:MAG: hypothetical protein JNK78_11960 [Planctomycetes bacterium]|nr:hypothetical protein [Planctomycetota bacterium]